MAPSFLIVFGLASISESYRQLSKMMMM